jgi:prepilin-type N-terminal cleavage/methylation domain-containing protein
MEHGRAKGFTLIEVLMVVIIIGILVALLLPAIAAAVRSAKNAAVAAEINQMAQALSAFKSKYGDYPPSRVYLSEYGYFPVTSNIQLSTGDITVGALAQRSLIALRKLFPRVVFSSQGQPPQVTNNFYYDFNGNGVLDQHPYILDGHQCLVFFLGGIPIPDPNTQTFGMSGFGKDPTNPFTSLAANPNRQPPFYDFNGGRLFLDPFDIGNTNAGTQASGMPGYYDTLNNAPPPLPGSGLPTTLNFFVYFSGYGNGVYDPNDVNFAYEVDGNAQGPIGLNFLYSGSVDPSVSPNPYATTQTNSTASGSVTFENAQTFQIFSAGVDGLYGVGGQYIASSQATTAANSALPFDGNNTFAGAAATTDGTIRQRENDNLTNFKSGTLQ